MQFDDLTPYVYAASPGDPPALNIGWRGDRHDFPTAEPFPSPVSELDRLLPQSTLRSRD